MLDEYNQPGERGGGPGRNGGPVPKSDELSPEEQLALYKETIDNLARDADRLLEAEPTPALRALRKEYLREMDVVIETMLAFHDKLVAYLEEGSESEQRSS